MIKALGGWSSRGKHTRPHSPYSTRPYSTHPFQSLIFNQILVILFFNYVALSNAQGQFFRSLLNVPDHCESSSSFGVTACTFLFSCYLDGGTPSNQCGVGFLYTCCEKPIATVRSDISNDINAFRFFSEPVGFRPKIRTFSRSRSPPPPLSHSLFRAPSNAIPVRSGLTRANDFPPKYYFTDREQTRLPLQTSDERYYNEPECGLQQTKQFAKRIIGGNEAKFAELPWQAHIRISGYQCGGVLLNRFYVATAAHCVHKARLNQIKIHLGEYDTKDTGDYYEPFPKETFSVVEKRTHPRFRYMLTQPDRFDVAVLRLSRPVTYRQNIVPICLPSPADDFEDSVGIVAGWGKTDTSFGKTGTNILRKVIVPVIGNKECLRWHHLKGIDVKLHYEMFCAGHSEGKMDACLGDSGGPLVIHHRGRWRLAGITSAGFGCAVDHQPGIYHKVSVTAGWIAANIRP